ncbi:glycerol-3-phosphate 1-O-acyltransferase [Pseudonocardia sp. KRD291]|uniref:glycerol-3-phosphate 1-O-acyltransferase n=1 Tax=Pseudonocardia sp. KRD291 TaxID=2792007 RepID=UPI001C5C5CA0|nr:glycerol-3-phosphate 1-O-acyltransferase [Pseudonocardia sp. KRD291]MBW0104616.1 glycerol-3-phosphate 1-O-acyltransferase [Pseudonocardia sp. KRD291]
MTADGRDAAEAVVLTHARSATERSLLEKWASEHHPGAPVVAYGDGPAAPSGLESRLGSDATLVVPVRIAWIPPEGEPGAVNRVTELVSTLAMRRAPWRLHGQMARRVPESARIVAGEPATVGDLVSRFAAQEGGRPSEDDGRSGAFARFVVRQATLACDRAERRLLGDRYKVPRRMVEQITASARFRALAERLGVEVGKPSSEVARDLESCLHEMAAVQSPPAIDTFRTLMGPLHTKAWDVKVDEAGLERLRELNKEHALVFLPSHRSYSDPLLFAEVLHDRDFPRNHVLGGNNLSFWPMGALGRRAGIVFIRRTFGGDTIYKAAIQEYLGHLMAKRFNLEWYIEGGRSRTGKLRRPRYGLLRYLAAALEDRPELDAVLVPVSIVYDQLHEVGAMAAEQRGGSKKAEGLGWLAGYFRDQRRHIGTAQVRFGEPFSLRESLAESEQGSAQLEKVAFRVCAGINRVSPATATSLVTFALLTARDRALTLQQLRDVVAPLADYLEARGVPVPVAELRTRHGMRMTLDRLAEAEVVTIYEGGTEPVFSISRGRHHVAAFYRNGALHHLLNRALTEVALLRAGDASDGEDLLELGWRELTRLRDLLKFEFFFSDKREFAAEIRGELSVLDPQWRQSRARPADARAALRQAPLLVAPGVLRSFLDAQLVVAEQLLALETDPPADRDEFLEICLGVGRQMLLQHRLDRADSVSRELYATALRLADNRDLVEPSGGDGDESSERGTRMGWAPVQERRRAWRDELAGLIDDLTRIGRLERARLEVVLGGRAESSDSAPSIGADPTGGADVAAPGRAGPDPAGDTGVAS